MCNWGWLLGPVGGVLVGNEQKKRKAAQRNNQLANQQLTESLNKNNETLENVNKAVDNSPIKTLDTLTNSSTSLKPKRTISTLAIASRNNGLNVR